MKCKHEYTEVTNLVRASTISFPLPPGLWGDESPGSAVLLLQRNYALAYEKRLQRKQWRTPGDVLYRCERGELFMVFAWFEGVRFPHSGKNRCLSGFSWTWQGGHRGGRGYLSRQGDGLYFPLLQQTNVVRHVA